MCDEQRDIAYYLTKAEDHRQKAKAVSEPRLKAALEEVAREYIAKARALYPSLFLIWRELSPLSRSASAAVAARHIIEPQRRAAVQEAARQQPPAEAGTAAAGGAVAVRRC
jgi:predicted TIM-barrel fold metal-dependent hydrolase